MSFGAFLLFLFALSDIERNTVIMRVIDKKSLSQPKPARVLLFSQLINIQLRYSITVCLFVQCTQLNTHLAGPMYDTSGLNVHCANWAKANRTPAPDSAPGPEFGVKPNKSK